MYFISRTENGKSGIVDTKDWVEEVYSKEEVENFINKGIVIEGKSFQKLLLGFLWSYRGVFTEVGSGSCMDLVDSYLISGDYSSLRYEVGGSTLDIIISLRDKYLKVKEKYKELDITSLGRDYKLFDDVCSCIDSEYSRDGSLEKSIDLIYKRYHFDKKIIKESLWL